MLQLRSRDEVGSADAGWLRAKHHFAIGSYANPAHKPVGNLIVLNDDEIAPHTGFALHHHANIEIVTYVYDGTITHRDDQGNVVAIHAGDVQAMSAGTGIPVVNFRVAATSPSSILAPSKSRGILSGVVGIKIDMET